MYDALEVEAPPRHFFAGQLAHFLLLAALLPGVWALAGPALGDGALLGLGDRAWCALAVVSAPLLQVVVVLGWRAQLCFRLLTRWFGRRDLLVWSLAFFPLLILRPLSTLGLALADRGSLGWPPLLGVMLGTVLLVPAVYALWSVHRFFGFVRATGADHFRESCRRQPLVRRGAFRWSSNAMYSLGFLMFWSIALLADSRAALAVALFQHAYIFVHLYCTEEPDLRVLHGAGRDAR